MSHQYFISSINASNKFIAKKCPTYSDYLFGSCNDNEEALMGDPVSEDARGVFFLRTSKTYPYTL